VVEKSQNTSELGVQLMKAKAFGGAAVAMAAISIALAGTLPAEAKGKAHRAPKPAAEKHKCGGKNGCPAAGESAEKPSAPSAEKPAGEK
jgi:FlaG/FlaF family flagellin (archaellin)